MHSISSPCSAFKGLPKCLDNLIHKPINFSRFIILSYTLILCRVDICFPKTKPIHPVKPMGKIISMETLYLLGPQKTSCNILLGIFCFPTMVSTIKLHPTLYTLHTQLYYLSIMHTAYGTIHIARWTLHIANCKLHISHCNLHTAHCILNAEHCKLYIITAHCTYHTASCTLHTAHWTLLTEQCKLHTAHCTLHTAPWAFSLRLGASVKWQENGGCQFYCQPGPGSSRDKWQENGGCQFYCQPGPGSSRDKWQHHPPNNIPTCHTKLWHFTSILWKSFLPLGMEFQF